ncbi:hypothetical protein [Streptomyces sp. NPDC051211]|uniref:DUF6893 family small protein n=1 Tax=Streptomyces sp. NPDC051211 TaxID=3154643 RepID=UPI0034504DE4
MNKTMHKPHNKTMHKPHNKTMHKTMHKAMHKTTHKPVNKKAVVGGATAAVLVAVLKQFLPDVRRYLRMRRM